MTDQTTPPVNQWKTLDKDLARFSQLEAATAAVAKPAVAIGLSLVFVLMSALVAFTITGHGSGTVIIVVAAVFGAYMALNIGANDVANNMGPAVGARVLTMGGALLIAIVFETAGALIAGAMSSRPSRAASSRPRRWPIRAHSSGPCWAHCLPLPSG